MADFRVGRKLGRTIYRQLGPKPSDDDIFIGICDYAEDAEYIVSLLNLASRKPFVDALPNSDVAP